MKDINSYVNELNVLYEDNHLIVVEKFINILSQMDETRDFSMIEIVKEYIKQKYSKPGNVYLGLVHRLDRRVGGVMVFAKTSKAASRLSESVRNGSFKKWYLAKVYGNVKQNGNINIKLEKTKENIAKVSNDGKDAKLNYTVICHNEMESMLCVELITGRYNQIRASMAYINHPIINDYKYSKIFSVNNLELGLYCYKISFPHPITKEEIKIEKKPETSFWA